MTYTRPKVPVKLAQRLQQEVGLRIGKPVSVTGAVLWLIERFLSE